jgi:hypothetical protein
MKVKHYVKKHTKHVTIYDSVFIDKKKTIGEACGWVIKPGKAEDVFFDCADQPGLVLFKKYWDDLNIKHNAFLWKQFLLYPEYRGTGIQAAIANHDHVFKKMKCRYLLAIPEPLNVPDDKNQLSTRSRDESDFEKAREKLINLYIEKYYYRGVYKRHKDTGLIIKEMK